MPNKSTSPGEHQNTYDYLQEATKRVSPLRRSKPGVSLCFDVPEHEAAHNAVQQAKANLRNATGGSYRQIRERVEATLRNAGV